MLKYFHSPSCPLTQLRHAKLNLKKSRDVHNVTRYAVLLITAQDVTRLYTPFVVIQQAKRKDLEVRYGALNVGLMLEM